MVNKLDGTSTVIRNYKTDFAALRKQDLGMAPDIILSDGHEYGATHMMLERNPKAISVLVAEENKPEILELCKFSKYLLCSKEFAEKVANVNCDFDKPATLVNLYQTLKNRFPNNEIVITLKNRGALYSLNGEIKVMPGINAKVVDLTGAGDAFRGAFVYGLANNFEMDKIITYANIAAGLTTENLGVRNAFPALNDVISYYNQKFPPQVNQNIVQTQMQQVQTTGVSVTPVIEQSTQAPQKPNGLQSVQETVQVPISNQPVNQFLNNQVEQPPVQSSSNSIPTQAIPEVMPEIPKN